jgi:nucleoid DNA-binding protein|nr:MAG TPA: Bacterial DNA-binding protein [Caudoviricetes sp.]
MKNIKDLSKRVSENQKISQKDAHNIIEDTFNEISKILVEEGEEVRIKNFAVFKYGMVPGKKTKHPTTKEEIVIPDSRTIRLGLSTKIKKGLNGRELV